VKIFWSWQSDTPGKTGRHFVRDVLQAVVDELKQAIEVDEPTERKSREEIHLDHDRKGVGGSPDLARIILEKIEQSVVFVADVTPVGVVHEVPADLSSKIVKKIFNPNVGIELGYALHALTDRALLMVMNLHYGSRSDLPFDLQAKAGPITYVLAPDASKAAIEAEARAVKVKLLEAVRLCLSNRVETRANRPPFVAREAKQPPALFFEPQEPLASFGHPGEQEYRYESQQAAYIRLFPTYAEQPPVGLAKMTAIFEVRKPCPMSMVVGGLPARNHYGPIIIDPLAATTIAGLTQGFSNGELWGVNGKVFVPRQIQLGYPPRAEYVTMVPMIAFEKLFVRVLTNYVAIASSELRLTLPYTVELGAFGLNGAYLAVPGAHGQGELIGPIHESSVTSCHTLGGTSETTVFEVLRSFFIRLYDLAACSRADVLNDGQVAAHGLPRR